MELSIIILNYKTKRLLRQSLKGIAAYPPQVPYEVIVIDNGSGDGSAQMMREEFPDTPFVDMNENSGYARGSNAGIRAAKGQYLLFLNTDVIVTSGQFDALLGYLKQHDRVGAVGPRLQNPDGSLQDSAYAFHSFLTPWYQRTVLRKTSWGKADTARFLLQDWDHTTARPVAWLMSSCLLVRRQALEDAGLFDERYFVYLADTDLCRTLWTKGWQVHYAPVATFIHYHRKQSAGDWRIAKIHAVDWLRYLWKWRKQPLPEVKP